MHSDSHKPRVTNPKSGHVTHALLPQRPVAFLLMNLNISGQSAEEAAQERHRGRPAGAAGEDDLWPSGDSGGGRGGRGHGEAAAEAGAREGGVAEAAAVARRAHEAVGDGGGGQGGRVARG